MTHEEQLKEIEGRRNRWRSCETTGVEDILLTYIDTLLAMCRELTATQEYMKDRTKRIREASAQLEKDHDYWVGQTTKFSVGKIQMEEENARVLAENEKLRHEIDDTESKWENWFIERNDEIQKLKAEETRLQNVCIQWQDNYDELKAELDGWEKLNFSKLLKAQNQTIYDLEKELEERTAEREHFSAECKIQNGLHLKYLAELEAAKKERDEYKWMDEDMSK